MTGFFCLSVQRIFGVCTGLSCISNIAQEETEPKNMLGAKSTGRVSGSADKSACAAEGVR